MSIDFIIKNVMNEKQQIITDSEIKKYKNLIRKEGKFKHVKNLNPEELESFLKFFKKFQSCFNPEKKRLDPYYQMDIISLFRMKGNLEDMMEALTDSGYKIECYFNMDLHMNKAIFQRDLTIFEALLEDDLFKRYSEVFNALQKGLGYKDVSSYYSKKKELYKTTKEQTEKIIILSRLDGDVTGVIYLLGSNHYQLIEQRGLTEHGLIQINDIVKQIEKEKSQGRDEIPAYLYKQGNVEIFKNYFSSLPPDEQKNTLNTILKLDYENKDINNWIEKKHSISLQEVGLI